MNTVVEAVFEKLHYQTQWEWVEKWTDIEKMQLFAFYVKGYSLNKIDVDGEIPFEMDSQRYNFLREGFEIYYNEFFKKGRPSPDDLPDVETNSNNDETKKQQQ